MLFPVLRHELVLNSWKKSEGSKALTPLFRPWMNVATAYDFFTPRVDTLDPMNSLAEEKIELKRYLLFASLTVASKTLSNEQTFPPPIRDNPNPRHEQWCRRRTVRDRPSNSMTLIAIAVMRHVLE
jgi:hypothetical protein